jgi:hypothetical protein
MKSVLKRKTYFHLVSVHFEVFFLKIINNLSFISPLTFLIKKRILCF